MNWIIDRAGCVGGKGWPGRGLMLLAVTFSWLAHGQGATGVRAPAHLILTSRSESLSGQFADGRVLREIDDPHTGDRWLLMPDPANPGGPGRLVRYAAPGPDTPGPATRSASPAGMHPAPAPAVVPEALLPVIRTGDSLIVEENTARVEARLEAIALGPAASGSPFLVRLRIGGNVVRAVALRPGRAAFAVETEARP